METQQLDPIGYLSDILQKASQDHRLKPTHLTVYIGLFQQWAQERFLNPFPIGSRNTMALAKISSRVTYHKCIKELHDLGYIYYCPSYDYYKGTLVYMSGFGGYPRNNEGNNAGQNRYEG